MFTGRGHSSPIRSAAINASCGIETLPYSRILALPFFCFSNSFFLRVMPVLSSSKGRRPRPAPGQASHLAVTSLRSAAMVSRAMTLPPIPVLSVSEA